MRFSTRSTGQHGKRRAIENSNKEGGCAPNFTPLTVNEMTDGVIVEADVLIGNVEHLSVITMVDTISETCAVDIDALMADSAFATGPAVCPLPDPDHELWRTSDPRRRAAVRSTATRRWSRRGREVLLGRQDLPKSATAPMTNDGARSCFLFQGFQVILHLASCFRKHLTVAGGV